MECSDEENGSDIELIDDILGPEDLFNDEDYDNDNDIDRQTNAEEKPKVKVEKQIKQPRVVKKQRKTPNYDTLKGNNGLSALKKLFKNFKFKGNGYEKEDLTKIMGILQQWMCYQLCPQYDFESGISELESLGKKRIVQVLMKKYRLGMDEWGENESDAKNAPVDDEITRNTNEFDLFLHEETANVVSDEGLSRNEITPPTQEPEPKLTQEQLERIARNKKLAEERKLKRMNELSQPKKVNQQIEEFGSKNMSTDKIALEENS